jgi:hypothetical protein
VLEFTPGQPAQHEDFRGGMHCINTDSFHHLAIYHYISLSITNKMQLYTIFFTIVNVLHVSGGFSAHHQELKNVHTASGVCQACLLLPLAVAASKGLKHVEH